MTTTTETEFAAPVDDYVCPTSVAEAARLLAEVPGARPLAGGTDLMVQMRLGHRRVERVVDVTRIQQLLGIDHEDGSIGAGVRMRELLADPLVADRYTALVEAARLLGGRQIQAMATLGGNLCNASPAAETATPLLVHDTVAVIEGSQGQREVAVDELWTGPGSTVLAPDELLVRLRPGAVEGRSAYRRIELRRSVDIAVVSAAARLHVVAGEVRVARVAIGAAAPTPRRVPDAEAALVGVGVHDLDPAIERAAVLASAAAEPIDDTRAGAGYRRAMVATLAARALRGCLEGTAKG